MEIRPIKIEFPQEALDDLRARLRRVRWPNEIPGSGWDYGTNLDYMKKLVAYWLDEYDWRRQEGMLNQFPQYKANVDGLGIHFLKVDGRGPNPLPLIMLHGYP
jgi:epoxide hydrolase